MTSSISQRRKGERGKKEKKREREGRRGREREGKKHTLHFSGVESPRGVGTVCSRVGERVALSCGDVEGEGKGLKVRDSLQHCEHTPA